MEIVIDRETCSCMCAFYTTYVNDAHTNISCACIIAIVYKVGDTSESELRGKSPLRFVAEAHTRNWSKDAIVTSEDPTFVEIGACAVEIAPYFSIHITPLLHFAPFCSVLLRCERASFTIQSCAMKNCTAAWSIARFCKIDKASLVKPTPHRVYVNYKTKVRSTGWPRLRAKRAMGKTRADRKHRSACSRKW